MKPSLVDRAPACADSVLVKPGTSLSDLLADLAARMTSEQRGAFLAKMAAMDRERELTFSAVTLGRA